MAEHLTFLLLGLGNGATFAALAVALVVTYRSSGVLNFATGALALHAAYTYAYLRAGELLIPVPGLPVSVDVGGRLTFPAALVGAVLIEAVVGVLLYLAVFRPLRHAVPAARAVASLGVMIVLTSLLAQRVGTSPVNVTPIFPRGALQLGDIRVPADRLWFAGTVAAGSLALVAVFHFTRFGRATRAAAETEMGAVVTGLSPERLAVANWALSAAVAAVAGILIAPIVPLIPVSYTLFVVPALAAAVLGRFSAVLPAAAAGLAIGALQSEALFLQGEWSWLPASGTAELLPLAIIIGVLVVRGRPLPVRGMLVEQSLGRAPRPRTWWRPAVVAAPIAVVAMYALDGSYRSALMTSTIMAIVALSLVVVTGYLGQVSLAQLTLAGVSGFTSSRLGTDWGVPFPITPLLAAAVAAAVGVVVGLPALRTRGLVVGVATLALAIAVESLWFRNPDFNGGVDGARIEDPSLFGIDLGIGSGSAFPRPAFGLLCLAVLVLAAVLVARLRMGRLGSAMLAVKANERSAAAAGIDVTRVKLTGFAIGAYLAGIGGALLAYKQRTVTFESYNVVLGLSVFATAYLGGITSISGAMVAGALTAGGLVFVVLDRQVDFGQWYEIVAGLGVVVTVIQHPEGLVGHAHTVIARRRRAAAPAPTVIAPASTPATREVRTPRSAGRVLEVRDLVVAYGGVVAVDGATFAVERGEIHGLIGPNGAGKTTVLDAIAGFVSHEGDVVVDGRSVKGLPPHRRARLGIGRTFQSIDLYDDLTVWENVLAGRASDHHAAGVRPTTEACEHALDVVGLGHLTDRLVAELSQGQRQLVSIARALAGHPELLVLDEPAAGLDTGESRWLGQRLREIRASGATILLVDHDMSLVLDLCDQIHVLDFGRVIASGTPADIRADARVAGAYLGSTHDQEAVPA